jgi:hypothetical protein
MLRSAAISVLLGCGLFGAVPLACVAQAYTPPPPPLTTLPPCPAGKEGKKLAKANKCDPTVYPPETVETKGKKGGDAAPATPPTTGEKPAADRFPFPGAQPAPATAPPAAPAAEPAAKRFPFPGETAGQPAAPPASADQPGSDPSQPAAKRFPYPGEATPDVPHDAAAEKKAADTSAGKAFPYPGDPAPTAAPGASKPGDDASSSSSSSSDVPDAAPGKPSGSASAKNPDDDDDDDPPKLRDKGSSGRRTLKVIKPQSDDDRVDEDLSVAKFYAQSGNSMGAYMRAKDAVKLQPEYPPGHFALAEAAKKLNKKDEAVVEFQAYLKLAPDGEKAKAAEKALAELAPGQK